MEDIKVSRQFLLLSLLVILGTFVFYHFLFQNYDYAFAGILVGVVYYFLYIFYNLRSHKKRDHTEIFTEAIAVLSVFLFPMIVYGLIIFEGSIAGLILICVFTIMQLLNFVRNWSFGINNTKGFPVVLHGVFFPFAYFFSILYMSNYQEAVFLLYFVLTAMLSVSNFEFLKYQQSVFVGRDDEKIEYGVSEDEASEELKNVNVDELQQEIGVQQSQFKEEKIENFVEPIIETSKEDSLIDQEIEEVESKLDDGIQNMIDEDDDPIQKKEKISLEKESSIPTYVPLTTQYDELIEEDNDPIQEKETILESQDYHDDFDDEDEKFLNSISKA